MNCQPMRLLFVKSAAGKERLQPALDPGNRDKALSAPVTAIIAYDSRFYENLPSHLPVLPAAAQMFSKMRRLQPKRRCVMVRCKALT